jgi:hypothetical protein
MFFFAFPSASLITCLAGKISESEMFRMLEDLPKARNFQAIASRKPQRGKAATKESGAFTTEDTEVTESRKTHSQIFHQSIFLSVSFSVFSVRSVVRLPRVFASRTNLQL